MSEQQIMYAIARTEQEGLKGMFTDGPFKSYPQKYINQDSFVFELKNGKICCVKSPSQSDLKQLDDYLEYDFMDLLSEQVRRFDIFKVIEARLKRGAEIHSKQDLARIISAFDTCVTEYAYEMRYARDGHEDVANEIASYAQFRRLIWDQLSPTLPDAHEYRKEANPSSEQKGRFDFNKPRG